MENSKLIQTILKKKKLQQISQDCLGIIIPSSWLRAMNWNRHTKFIMEFHPLNKEMILREYEEVSDTESEPD